MPSRPMLAGAWTALILLATLVPSEFFPEGDESRAGPGTIPHADKAIHAAIFFGFGWAWTWAGPRRDRGRVAVILVSGLALTVITELGQGLPIIDRDPDTRDALADAVGLILGLGTAWSLGIGGPPPD